ncbi:MAG: PcfJ domain-containing protein, partial [Planctomycetota bacterium]
MNDTKVISRASSWKSAGSRKINLQSIQKRIDATRSQIVGDRKAVARYNRLIRQLSNKTNLLHPASMNHANGLRNLDDCLTVLRNLSGCWQRWQRPVEDWSFDSKKVRLSPRQALTKLIDHLLLKNKQVKVPNIFYQVWFRLWEHINREHLKLFTHLAAGNGIRGSHLGKQVTCRDWNILLDAPADAPIDVALRDPQSLLLLTQLDHPAGLTRRRRKKIRTAKISMSNDRCWEPIPVCDFYRTEENHLYSNGPRTWIVRQITSESELSKEGERMRHCVKSYLGLCLKKKCAIFTLEVRDIIRTRPLLTIDVMPETQEILEAKGYKNRNPKKEEMKVIEIWAR